MSTKLTKRSRLFYAILWGIGATTYIFLFVPDVPIFARPFIGISVVILAYYLVKWPIITLSVVSGLTSYGYARTDNILLLLTAAWFAAFATWNIFETLLDTFLDGTSAFERHLANFPQIGQTGLVVGTFSVAANFLMLSHWFLLAHGFFWIGIFIITFMGRGLQKGIQRDFFPTYYENELRGAFQGLGVQTKLSLGNRREMNITSTWRGSSFALFDVSGGAIRWINFSENRENEDTKYIEYGVPDARVEPLFPEVRVKARITSERVKVAPLGQSIVGAFKAGFKGAGREPDLVVNVRWRGKDHGLGIIDRLNGDVTVRQPLINAFETEYLKGDLSIEAYPKDGCWILTDETSSALPPKDLWDCYQALANHLLETEVPTYVS